jgi:methylenetetrahydrofolate dehydrogenase (NADP+) / methenyltetrahydrofolate cyclohydrolase
LTWYRPATVTARVLDGKGLAETIRAEVRAGVLAFRGRFGRSPGLDVVLVGDDPASVIYTRNKERASTEVGIRGKVHRRPASTSDADVVALLDELNADPQVDGILVQLPLPVHIDSQRAVDRIEAAKDVDGVHPTNAGRLAMGRPGALVPPTPAGCLRLLELSGVELEGANAVVVGPSIIVGRPMAHLLLRANATVTIAHSRTRDLPRICREADVLVAAVGKPHMIRGDWIKPGAVVIDVGTTRVDLPDGRRGSPATSPSTRPGRSPLPSRPFQEGWVR